MDNSSALNNNNNNDNNGNDIDISSLLIHQAGVQESEANNVAKNTKLSKTILSVFLASGIINNSNNNDKSNVKVGMLLYQLGCKFPSTGNNNSNNNNNNSDRDMIARYIGNNKISSMVQLEKAIEFVGKQGKQYAHYYCY